MGFSIDFDKISLDQYKKDIKNKDFIPGRQILNEQADIQFAAFKKAGIKNIEELFAKPLKLNEFSWLPKSTISKCPYLMCCGF